MCVCVCVCVLGGGNVESQPALRARICIGVSGRYLLLSDDAVKKDVRERQFVLAGGDLRHSFFVCR